MAKQEQALTNYGGSGSTATSAQPGRGMSTWLLLCQLYLLYGMESAALTAAEKQTLDGFQCSCLRKKLNIEATYYAERFDGAATAVNNSTTLQLADFPPLTATIAKQQTKLFGHALRADSTSLERRVCFTAAFNYRAAKNTVKKG